MTDDNPSKQFHLDKPDELLDEILDRLLQFDEQWPPAEETDQDRIEGVSAILHRGIEAAKIGLGIVSAVRLEDRTYLMERGPIAEDCQTCQTMRSYLQTAAVTALAAATILATVDSPHGPEFNRQIMPYLNAISTYEDMFLKLRASHQGAHE